MKASHLPLEQLFGGILVKSKKKMNFILLIIFIVSFILVVVGQKNIGYSGLGLELLGLAGILSVLCIYNQRYK